MAFNFKEILQRDCERVFLNPKEFGSLHKIDGKDMIIQIDDSEVTEREKKRQSETEGIYERQFLFYVLQKDFGLFPAVGRVIKIDSSEYRILDAKSEGGMYSITVGRKRV